MNYKKLLLLLLILLSPLMAQPSKNVLVLHSLNASLTWVKNIQKGIDENIKEKELNLHLYTEHMDMNRFNSKEYYKSLQQTYRLKYKGIKFDNIISVGNYSFDFLKEYRDDIFGNIPVSFCDVKFFKQDQIDGYKNYTGVSLNEDFHSNIRLMKKLNPNLKKVYIVVDYLKYGIILKEKILNQLKNNNYNLEFVFSPKDTFENMLGDIKKLDKNSAVLYTIYYKDTTGEYLPSGFTTSSITKSSKAPVYTLFETHFKNGVLGGNMATAYLQGKIAAQKANLILEGYGVHKIPIKTNVVHKTILNDMVRQDLNIDEENIGKDIILKYSNHSIFTKDELSWIVDNKEVIVAGGRDWMPYDFINKYGNYDGIINDILSLISKKTGLEFNIITHLNSSEIKESFKDDEIDILPATYYNNEDKKWGTFTKSYLKTKKDFFGLNANNFNNTNDLKNARIAWIKGENGLNEIQKFFPNMKVVFVNSVEDAITKLLNKELDTIFIENITMDYILKIKQIKNIVHIPQNVIDTKKLHMLIAKDNKYLLSIINKSLKDIDESELMDLKQKWSDSKLILTKIEKQWVENHQDLKVAVSPYFLPFSVIIKDESNAENLPKGFHGISIELLEKALNKLGITANFIETNSWNESIEAVKSGQVDILTTTAITKERRKYLRYSVPTITAPRAMLIRKDEIEIIKSLDDLKNKKVGLLKGSAVIESIAPYVKKTNIIWCDTFDGCIKNLQDKKIDVYADGLYTLASTITKGKFNNIKIAFEFDKNNHLSLALSKKTISKTGQEVINKAIESLTKSERNEIHKRWTNIKIEKKVDYTLVYQIAGVLIIFLIGTLYWGTKLNKAKKIAIKATLEANEARKKIDSMYKHTQDSINYASLIQGALIPDNKMFDEYFDDSFVIWEPKDVVGGDIYLFEELARKEEKECILMVVDCTGHGVPGAFVTMLVKALERQIIAKINHDKDMDISPAWILSYFNRKMKTLLKQENVSKDTKNMSNAGFDGSIVYYNKTKNIFKCASARNDIFYIQEDELKVIKSDRHSIGYRDSKSDFVFKDTIMDIQDEISFYIASDGFWDQNGGENDFCYGKKRLKELLMKNKNKSMEDQKNILVDSLKEYQSDYVRNDDITFVGLKMTDNKQTEETEKTKEIEENNVLISINDILTQEIIDDIVNEVESKMNAIPAGEKLTSKVSYIAIEQLQNMLHYQKNKTISKCRFELGYNLKKQKYYITSANEIEAEDKEKISKKLDYINSLDKSSLRKYFKELLTTSADKHDKGAGVGLVDVAKKSSEKIEYNFKEIDNMITYQIVVYI